MVPLVQVLLVQVRTREKDSARNNQRRFDGVGRPERMWQDIGAEGGAQRARRKEVRLWS